MRFQRSFEHKVVIAIAFLFNIQDARAQRIQEAINLTGIIHSIGFDIYTLRFPDATLVSRFYQRIGTGRQFRVVSILRRRSNHRQSDVVLIDLRRQSAGCEFAVAKVKCV